MEDLGYHSKGAWNIINSVKVVVDPVKYKQVLAFTQPQ